MRHRPHAKIRRKQENHDEEPIIRYDLQLPVKQLCDVLNAHSSAGLLGETRRGVNIPELVELLDGNRIWLC